MLYYITELKICLPQYACMYSNCFDELFSSQESMPIRAFFQRKEAGSVRLKCVSIRYITHFKRNLNTIFNISGLKRVNFKHSQERMSACTYYNFFL